MSLNFLPCAPCLPCSISTHHFKIDKLLLCHLFQHRIDIVPRSLSIAVFKNLSLLFLFLLANPLAEKLIALVNLGVVFQIIPNPITTSLQQKVDIKIPQLHSFVLTGSSQGLAIGTERHASDRSLMTSKSEQFLP